MTPLPWGRRFLMCRPDHFGVLYEINPWMNSEVRPDPERAMEQFDGLLSQVRAAGAEVELLEPVADLPDLVFTANAGVVDGRRFVPARFRHPERQGETAHDAAWFASHGFTVDWLPEGVAHEGAGDALPFGAAGAPPVLVSGYRFRSDAAAHVALSRLTGAPVRLVELVDERLYHLDLTFCPLDDRRAMVAPLGLDSYGRKVIEALVPEVLALEDEEALAFCANSVVIGTNVIMARCPPRVGRILEGWGFSVSVAPVDEFLMAGGSCRCLTLALDVDLGGSAASVRIEAVPAEVTFPLRQRVLRPHQTIAQLALPGDDDPDSLHVAAREPGGPVLGTATVRREPPPWDPSADTAWRLRGMATSEELRGRGIGARVLDAVVAHVASHGGGLLWCNARVPAAPFYRRAGFVTRGEAWDEPDIGPHVAMWRQVDSLGT